MELGRYDQETRTDFVDLHYLCGSDPVSVDGDCLDREQ